MSDKAYLQFQLEDAAVKLTKCEPKKATRGNKEVVNTYSDWEYTGHAIILGHFHSELRPALLVKTDTKDGLDPDHRPLVRFAPLGWIPWDWKSSGYNLVVPRGVSGTGYIRGNIELIDNFRFKVLEGDRCTIRWRTRSDLADAERGVLTGMVGQTFPASFLPPGDDYVAPEPPAKKSRRGSAPAVDEKQQELAGAEA